MRLVQVNSTCGVGSTGRIATDIARDLAAHDGQCLIAYGRNQARAWDDTYRIGGPVNIISHGLQTRLLDRHGLASGRATGKLVEQLREFDPDLVHLHNIHGYYLDYEVLFDYLKQAGKPVVWTLHDCWLFTGHCAYFTYAGCERWRTGCGSCPQRREYPASWLVDASRSQWRRKRAAFTSLENMILVTPSQWLADLVAESFLSEYEVRVIPNTVDTEIFRPRTSDFAKRHGLEGNYLVLGVASGWPERKGLHHLIDLLPMLRPDERLVVVGVTDDQRKQLPAEVTAITRTDSPVELAEIYSACDLYLNPTMEDNYATTNLEAAACGTRVATFDSGGSREAVDGDWDLVITDKTAHGLRAAIDQARADERTTRPPSAPAATMTERYLDLYAERLGSAG